MDGSQVKVHVATSNGCELPDRATDPGPKIDCEGKPRIDLVSKLHNLLDRREIELLATPRPIHGDVRTWVLFNPPPYESELDDRREYPNNPESSLRRQIAIQVASPSLNSHAGQLSERDVSKDREDVRSQMAPLGGSGGVRMGCRSHPESRYLADREVASDVERMTPRCIEC
ncbi:MAG: hypothetical protein AAGC53_14030 [Actinomycetota bacterium]